MQRIDDNTIALNNEEAEAIREFIYNSLYNSWDRWTDMYVSRKSLEEGMRSMSPEMYDLMGKLSVI